MKTMLFLSAMASALTLGGKQNAPPVDPVATTQSAVVATQDPAAPLATVVTTRSIGDDTVVAPVKRTRKKTPVNGQTTVAAPSVGGPTTTTPVQVWPTVNAQSPATTPQPAPSAIVSGEAMPSVQVWPTENVAPDPLSVVEGEVYVAAPSSLADVPATVTVAGVPDQDAPEGQIAAQGGQSTTVRPRGRAAPGVPAQNAGRRGSVSAQGAAGMPSPAGAPRAGGQPFATGDGETVAAPLPRSGRARVRAAEGRRPGVGVAGQGGAAAGGIGIGPEGGVSAGPSGPRLRRGVAGEMGGGVGAGRGAIASPGVPRIRGGMGGSVSTPGASDDSGPSRTELLDMIEDLRSEVQSLRAEVKSLRKKLTKSL